MIWCVEDTVFPNTIWQLPYYDLKYIVMFSDTRGFISMHRNENQLKSILLDFFLCFQAWLSEFIDMKMWWFLFMSHNNELNKQ